MPKSLGTEIKSWSLSDHSADRLHGYSQVLLHQNQIVYQYLCESNKVLRSDQDVELLAGHWDNGIKIELPSPGDFVNKWTTRY